MLALDVSALICKSLCPLRNFTFSCRCTSQMWHNCNLFSLFCFLLTGMVVDVSAATGVMLDPVYTVKAVHGMLSEMRNNPSRFRGRRVLYIHTGEKGWESMWIFGLKRCGEMGEQTFSASLSLSLLQVVLLDYSMDTWAGRSFNHFRVQIWSHSTMPQVLLIS